MNQGLIATSLKKHYPNFLFYGLSILLSCSLLLTILYTQGFHIRMLPNYDQDGLSIAVIAKSLIEFGFPIHNPQLGAPYNYDLVDYPLSENATFLFLKLLSFISSNYVIVLNLFFILSFILATVTSLFVFRVLGLNKPLALAASLLFTFLPYPFLRMEMGHLFLGSYYVIPIYIGLMFFILQQDLFYVPNAARDSKTRLIGPVLLILAACVFVASSGIYYAFFGCYLLLFSGLAASIDKRKWLPLGKAGLMIVVISLVTLMNMLPAMYARIERGPNDELAIRNPAEAEHYGLKISQLLLPVDRHRIGKFSRFKDFYNSNAPLVNENKTATLGLIGGIGFLFLILILLLGKSVYRSDTLFNLSRLNMAALLLGTIGGLGSLFSYVISPMIRGYNRISIFLAFLSLAAFFLILQEIVKHQSSALIKKTMWTVVLIITIVGMVDLMPHMSFSKNQAQFVSDENFVRTLEAKMPAGTMIMQLPFMSYPESPMLNEMGSYSLFRGYLHSHQLHWSFGAMRGRGVDLWQGSISKKPVEEMLADLTYAGFTGIYIFRKGYADQGQVIEKQLTHLLHTGPLLVNDQNDIAFFDLRAYAKRKYNSVTHTEWQSQVKRVYADIDRRDKFRLVWGNDFYQLEQANNTNWRWSKRKSQLQLYNLFDHDIKVKLKFRLYTGYPEYASVKLSGDLFKQKISANQLGTEIQREFVVPPGKHTIYFKTNAKQVNAGADVRNLFFAVYDFASELV